LLPLAAAAQQPRKVVRLGYLMTGSPDSYEATAVRDSFRQGLRELCYTADNNMERFPDLASELFLLKVNVIVAPNTPAARAAQQATTTISRDPAGTSRG
jgi:putative ABC transport system substrate-binding protein